MSSGDHVSQRKRALFEVQRDLSKGSFDSLSGIEDYMFVSCVVHIFLVCACLVHVF